MSELVALIEIKTVNYVEQKASDQLGCVILEGLAVGELTAPYLVWCIPFNRSLSMSVPIHKIENINDEDVRLYTYFDDEALDFIRMFNIGRELFSICAVDKETFDDLETI